MMAASPAMPAIICRELKIPTVIVYFIELSSNKALARFLLTMLPLLTDDNG